MTPHDAGAKSDAAVSSSVRSGDGDDVAEAAQTAQAATATAAASALAPICADRASGPACDRGRRCPPRRTTLRLRRPLLLLLKRRHEQCHSRAATGPKFVGGWPGGERRLLVAAGMRSHLPRHDQSKAKAQGTV
eukprot:356225-Chlamydomonas_euryale.AAC.14